MLKRGLMERLREREKEWYLQQVIPVTLFKVSTYRVYVTIQDKI